MSKRYGPIEKSLNLPSLSDIQESLDEEDIDEENYEYDTDDDNEPSYEQLKDKINALSKSINESQEINSKVVDKYHEDVNELYSIAKNGYEEVFNAALAMEPAQGAKFLQGAAKLLEISLRSKNSTMDKQIEMAKLQLRREEMMMNKKPRMTSINDEDDDDDDDESTEGKVYDRNEILNSTYKKDE